MIIICDNDEEEAAAWRAMEVINNLRHREPMTVRPAVANAPWIRTRWANQKYL
jgi:hypothetical protein